jgi:hypothetical protein
MIRLKANVQSPAVKTSPPLLRKDLLLHSAVVDRNESVERLGRIKTLTADEMYSAIVHPVGLNPP